MRKKLGEILLASGVVTQADLDLALNDQTAGEPARVGDLLVALGRLTPTQLARALSTQHAIPFIQLPPIPSDVLRTIPLEFQQQHRLVPFRVTGDAMSIAMADPSDADAVEELRVSMNKRVTRYVAASDEIDAIHAGLSGTSVDLPAPPPPSRAAHAPTAAELFGSLDLDATAPLGDELFSGLDLPPPSTADLPPPPAIAPVSPSPFEDSIPPDAELLLDEPVPEPKSSRREEEEPEFFESTPAVVAARPQPPPSIAPSPAPGYALSDDVSIESAHEGLTSSPSGTFDLTSSVEEMVVEEEDAPAAPVPVESSGTFEVALTESGNFGPAPAPETFDVALTESGNFGPAPAVESSGTFEVPLTDSGDFGDAPRESSGTFEVALNEGSGDFGAPAPAPAVESSGSFEVALTETSGNFPQQPAPAAADDFFAETGVAPQPVASGAFSSDVEEAVSFEELPADSTLESIPDNAEPLFDAGAPAEGLFAEPPAPAAPAPFEFPPPPEPAPPEAAPSVAVEEPQPAVEPIAAPEPAPAEPPSSLPSWLGPGGAPAAPEAAPGFVLQPAEWTGKLDDVPPSRLIVGAVKALVLKGLVTEAEILEALAKKS
ncbi:MAG: hypothetical protein JNM69_30280 [Archangium sp.]|nr:hypothetical protein [Archangium sp.]